LEGWGDLSSFFFSVPLGFPAQSFLTGQSPYFFSSLITLCLFVGGRIQEFFFPVFFRVPGRGLEACVPQPQTAPGFFFVWFSGIGLRFFWIGIDQHLISSQAPQVLPLRFLEHCLSEVFLLDPLFPMGGSLFFGGQLSPFLTQAVQLLLFFHP